MYVLSLSLSHFRGYGEQHQELAPGLNLIYGENGQGKTTLLEAIGVLATSKSFRGSRDDEMIGWDLPAASVSATVARSTAADIDLEVGLSRTARKSLVINSTRVHRASDFVGQLKAVSFSSADLEVIRGEPARRRRFLDLEISQLSPAYCLALGSYRKVLEQRNRLLKEIRAGGEDTLAAWNGQLLQHGARLMHRRRQWVEQMEDPARQIHEELSGGKERLSLVYQPSFRISEGALTEENLRGEFEKALAEVRREESYRQVTLAGPHRDELLLLINGRDSRLFGSQGQQRSAMLAIRLAEMELIRNLVGEPPVCLLDDVFSELDTPRRERLLRLAQETAQILLTAADLDSLPAELRRGAALLKVTQGRISLQTAVGQNS